MSTSNEVGLYKQVEDALEQIRPFLKEDGGDVELMEVTQEGDVKLTFKGACRNCSMKMMTFKAGLEDTIKRNVPDIKSVIEV